MEPEVKITREPNSPSWTILNVEIIPSTYSYVLYFNCEDGAPGQYATYQSTITNTSLSAQPTFWNVSDLHHFAQTNLWVLHPLENPYLVVGWRGRNVWDFTTNQYRLLAPAENRVYPLILGPVDKPAKQDAQKDAGTKEPEKTDNPTTDPEKEAGDPVDLLSGSYTIGNTDLAVPGIIPIQVSRSYSSAFADEDGPFGKGTSLTPYNASVTVKKEGNGTVTTVAGTELTYSAGNHTKVTFKDIQGNLQFTATGQTGFAGVVITVQKNAAGNMLGAVLSKSNGDKFLFNVTGDLSSIQDRKGNTVSINRDATRRITRLADPSTNKGIDFTYDSSGHITQVSGLSGQIITYQYDGQGRLASVTDSLNHTASFTYDNNGQIIVATDARGTQMVQNTYNTDGRVTHQILGDGSTMDIAYPSDTVRRVTDGNGHVREHRYESHGLFTGLKTPLNQEYTKTYSPAFFDNSAGPRTITSIDPLGRQSTTEFNSFNQPVRIMDAAGRTTEFTYEPIFHLLSTIKDPLGRVTHFTYDALGNVISTNDPDGNSSTFTYNPLGQVLTATDAMNQKVQYQYNSSHDMTQITDPMGNKTTFVYDALSRLTKITDSKGNSTSYTYDILNRITEIMDALSHKTTFAYDENGNVTTITDPRGNTTTASYDPLNRLASVTNTKGETNTITYDGAGNVNSVIDAKGQMTTYAYDVNDRKIQVQYGDGTTHTYTYDTANRLTKVGDGTSNWTFAYDILDRLITASTPQGALNYTYDLVSRLTGFSSPNTNYAPVQYAYDNLNRLISISQNGKTYSLNYDAIGRRTGLDRPNGVTTSYEYDTASHPLSLTHSKGTQVLEKHDYVYDTNGNIMKYLRGKGTSQPVVIRPCGKNGKGKFRRILGYVADKAEEIERTYTYDALGRLTSVSALGMVPSASKFKNSGNKLAAALLIEQARRMNNANARKSLLRNAEKLGAVLPESANWTFDENGNILTKTVHETDRDKLFSYAYDEADRLVEVVRPVEDNNDHPGWPRHRHPKFRHGPKHRHSCSLPTTATETIDFSYDGNGNMVSDETGRTLTWNALDQLTRLQDGNATSQYSYDPLGRRVSFTKGATTRTYFYKGLNLLSDGQSKFLDGFSLDEHLQVDSPNTSQSFLQDHLGSVSQLLDSTNGSSKTRYDYQSYGKLEGDLSNRSLTNPYTYTGREDDGTGLMYYRARYYDPELEMFISQDPMGDKQRYVGGNPLRFIDPLGLYTLNIIITEGFTPWHFDTAYAQAQGIGGDTRIAASASSINALIEMSNASHADSLTDLNILSHGSENSLGGTQISNVQEALGLFSTIGNAPVNISLYACNTGKGQGNVAELISRAFPSTIVKAPNAYYGGQNIFNQPWLSSGESGALIPNYAWWLFGLQFRTYQGGTEK